MKGIKLAVAYFKDQSHLLEEIKENNKYSPLDIQPLDKDRNLRPPQHKGRLVSTPTYREDLIRSYVACEAHILTYSLSIMLTQM